MIDVNVDIAALAGLARLEVSEAEMETLKKQIPDILSFVHTIESVSAAAEEVEPTLKNVMRDDTDAYESGIYTEDLLKAAPKSRDNQVVVKQVISRKK